MLTEKTVSVLGEWKDDATGYDCLLMQGPFALCGYVRIPEGHPLHNVAYNEEIPPSLQWRAEEIMNEPVGKRGAIDLFCMAGRGPRAGDLFDVHGSVTFSGKRNDSGFWYGFDLGHAGDEETGISQDDDYAKQECASLAAQLARCVARTE